MWTREPEGLLEKHVTFSFDLFFQESLRTLEKHPEQQSVLLDHLQGQRPLGNYLVRCLTVWLSGTRAGAVLNYAPLSLLGNNRNFQSFQSLKIRAPDTIFLLLPFDSLHVSAACVLFDFIPQTKLSRRSVNPSHTPHPSSLTAKTHTHHQADAVMATSRGRFSRPNSPAAV